MSGRTAIAEITRRSGGVLAVRAHPELARTAQREARSGRLVLLFPGVYVVADQALDQDVRIRAAAAWYPSAVFTGAAAARLTFWPSLRVGDITMSAAQLRKVPAGFAMTREVLPSDFVVDLHGVRVTAPALTALDLGGPGIDHALLQRATTLGEMRSALDATPRRAGNRQRRRLLHDSRDEPWSEAERLTHALLRHARIAGWRANHEVSIAAERYVIDIAFPGLMVAIEIDGFETHSSRAAFERDRRKGSDLVCFGWTLLRFTWHHLVDDPAWVLRVVRATLDRVARSADAMKSRRSAA